MSMEKVTVVVPIYTAVFRDQELRSMRQAAAVLSRWPFVLVAPEGLDTTVAEGIYAGCRVVRVSGEWLGKKNGTAGYNKMMMSKEFYDLFPDTDYMLICQNDAWIFRDELEAWCDKGYDYVGAPFPGKWILSTLPARAYLALRRKLASGILRQDLIGRCYNGGLSLRRVQKFARACETYRDQAAAFLANPHHLYNEDVFWSLVPCDFHYPGATEALGFAFDVKPAYCLKLAHGKLPFGCHGWFKPSVAEFWRRIIG